MKYEDMTWLEINHAIAEILEPNATQIQESRFNAFENDNSVEIFVDDDIVEYDFSKPSDAWPIIVDNGIDITSPCTNGTDEWQAGKFYIQFSKQDIYVFNKKPLRAAMICFLKMKDAESNAN